MSSGFLSPDNHPCCRHKDKNKKEHNQMANEQNLIPAKKGEIRNPKGRGKGTLNRKTLMRKWLTLTEEGRNPITKETETMSQADLVLLTMLKKARAGDFNSQKFLIEMGTYDEQDQTTEQAISGTFYDYFEKVAGEWLQVRPFAGDILNQITDFIFDDDKKVLMLAMPQGSGKSYIANKLTEWLLGDFQTQQSKRSNSVMRVCNTDSNVTKFQAAISNEIMGDGWRDFFGSHKLSNNNKNGMRFAGSWNDNAFFTSAKSSVMSRRADFLIFDDLYASMGEALSPSATSDYIMKFQTMWRGRLKGSDIGKIIMVGTRYAKNDFYQQVVDMYPDSSTVINIPAINDDGESFCEETHPIEELLHDRDTMNIDLFNAIYQQNPTAEGFINPFKDWEPTFAPMTENQFDYTCTVADPSFGVGGDFFMVGKFGYNRNGQAALLDLLCERVCSDEMYIQFIEKANCNRNFIEGNGVGGMLIKRVCNITRAPLFPFTSIGNKIERIYMNAKDIMKLTFSDKIENIPFDQMTDFGTADHDDFPDMLSHFFNNIKIYGK